MPDRPPKYPGKPVPGIPTSTLWTVPPRAATRSHPGTETTSDRPPADTSAPPPKSTTQKASNAIPPWAVGVVAVVTALGGSKILDALTTKAAATPEQITKVAQEARDRDEKILAYLQGQAEDQAVRDAIHLSVLCTVNGGPPARGLMCPINACEQRALTPDGKIVAGQPACRSVEEWPKTRRPP
jgi:hypothetical protein